VTVEALRRGDPEVLGDLLRDYGSELQGIAYLILGDRSEAEDVVSDTLLAALDGGASLREATALRSWLIRIATNRALRIRRRLVRIQLVPEIPERAAGQSIEQVERMTLLIELGNLPVRMRAAVVLHYYADLPVSAVAVAMGTSPNTVKTQLRLALERLRQSLSEEAPLVPHVEVGHV
jgi:RNA polymerase sigma factor (sigma-70 family)